MTIPASPSEIQGNESLAELEAIQLAWIASARQQQIPDKIFHIALSLGENINPPHYPGIHRLLDNGWIRIWATVVSDNRNIVSDDWNYIRKLTVYREHEQCTLLAEWSWTYHAETIESEPIDLKEGTGLFFIPGNWVERVLALSEQAEKARIDTEKELEEQKRDALARRLLCGNYYFGNG